MASGHTFTIKEKGGGDINYDDNYEMPDYSGLTAYTDVDEGDDGAFIGLFGHSGPGRQAARTQASEKEAEGERHEEDGEDEEDDDNGSTFRLEGYEDLDDDNDVSSGAQPSDSDYTANDASDSDDNENNNNNRNNGNRKSSTRPPPAKKTRPAHFSRSISAARRAALRTQVDAAHSFLLQESRSGSAFTSPARRVRSSLAATGAGTGGDAGSVRSMTPMGPTQSKKVTADLDSEDDLIMSMRSAGYTDAQIATRLTKEGRHTYNSKSISTRIARIKYAQNAHSDYLLKEGYKEWTHADDLRLMQACEFAEMEIQYEIEKVKAWRWKKVSEFLRRMDATCVFSDKACRERFIGLQEGTAKIPIDEDDDPEARRKEMEEYRDSRERARMEEENKKREEEELKRRIKEEARLRSSQKAEATAKKREQKQKERAQKAMQKAAKSQVRLARAEENSEQKQARADALRQKKREQEEREEQALLCQNKNMHVPLTFVADLKSVTAETPDPRIFLDMEDLKDLCRERKLSDEGDRKEDLVKRLRDADDMRPLAELKKMCRMRGLNTAGTKMQQKYQLALAEAKKYPSFVTNTSGSHAEDDADGE